MPWTSAHLDWLMDTGQRLTTVDGKTVEVWEFSHVPDEAILSAWARHFRNHYCLDGEIDLLRAGTGLDRADYLLELTFPDSAVAPGPSVRAGDFAEILVADYLAFILGYWVPRFRYDQKSIRSESEKGTDILGFRLLQPETESPDDILACFEAKAKLTGTSTNTLQSAVNDSKKDVYRRKAETLNALKRRLIRAGQIIDAKKVERFQDEADRPYRQISGAAAVLSGNCFNEELIRNTQTAEHPNVDNLLLVVIKGEELMPLVHELYRRAADEA